MQSTEVSGFQSSVHSILLWPDGWFWIIFPKLKTVAEECVDRGRELLKHDGTWNEQLLYLRFPVQDGSSHIPTYWTWPTQGTPQWLETSATEQRSRLLPRVVLGRLVSKASLSVGQRRAEMRFFKDSAGFSEPHDLWSSGPTETAGRRAAQCCF